MSSALPLPQPPPSPRLTESLCAYFPSSYVIVWHEEVPEFHADHHNGTQVRHLVEARPAVGKWASMRHYVMAFGTGGGDVCTSLSQCSYQRRQSEAQRGHQLHGVFTASARARHVVR